MVQQLVLERLRRTRDADGTKRLVRHHKRLARALDSSALRTEVECMNHLSGRGVTQYQMGALDDGVRLALLECRRRLKAVNPDQSSHPTVGNR